MCLQIFTFHYVDTKMAGDLQRWAVRPSTGRFFKCKIMTLSSGIFGVIITISDTIEIFLYEPEARPDETSFLIQMNPLDLFCNPLGNWINRWPVKFICVCPCRSDQTHACEKIESSWKPSQWIALFVTLKCISICWIR